MTMVGDQSTVPAFINQYWNLPCIWSNTAPTGQLGIAIKSQNLVAIGIFKRDHRSHSYSHALRRTPHWQY